LLVCRIEKKRGHIYVNALAGPPVDMLTNSCSSHIVVLYKLFNFLKKVAFVYIRKSCSTLALKKTIFCYMKNIKLLQQAYAF